MVSKGLRSSIEFDLPVAPHAEPLRIAVYRPGVEG